ncbi:hypothetical protein [Trinickia sp. LjRoot230]|uniref:hypothetical protein n=1 Tax=Trinickia sp. LjRoot230 TaxID=3342288 RepID=UPI003F50C752
MGLAACLSYLLAGIVVLFVMRMLGAMAIANPGIGSFTEYTRIGLANWAGFINGCLYSKQRERAAEMGSHAPAVEAGASPRGAFPVAATGWRR